MTKSFCGKYKTSIRMEITHKDNDPLIMYFGIDSEKIKISDKRYHFEEFWKSINNSIISYSKDCDISKNDKKNQHKIEVIA